ncbi:MAG TPA: aldehyde dehydrogenase family protein [Cytophagaceae bacterium]|jgi:aldehyde dehydrogenase (NAD+)|nr:aldehyde dehydrogenase family protein [Cytophagaceae bacterium]
MVNIAEMLVKLGIQQNNPCWSTGMEYGKSVSGLTKEVFSPVDGKRIASVFMAGAQEYEKVISTSLKAFEVWRQIPAPKRGEIVRQIGEQLRLHKETLGHLVSCEMGKILQEGLGEVQEMIDICDFAVGLSRQLYGLTMHSERLEHRMYEQYHPLGVVGIISAFNFPVAVWAWNAMLAAVCGDVCVWKPSEKTPLSALACQYIIREVLRKNNVPEGVFSVVIGDASIGELMSADERLPLISATGSVRMGKKVGAAVGARLGRALLELGGNNAIIITENANLDLALRAVVFGAVGTCGQRCTSTRRLIVHESVYEVVKTRLLKSYENLPIGNPLEKESLIGPLIDKEAIVAFLNALKEVEKEGGKIIAGGSILKNEKLEGGHYVTPAIVEANNDYQTVQKETFAPILYLIVYKGDVNVAIRMQNNVKQGLSSALFSSNLGETENFLSHWGSDCGIANINIGTSGAEIGGAFGGEKETGGGRESGSDAWKIYMRRQTNTINFGNQLPLAQGIEFDL